jgi:hypothetical protein
MDQSMFYTGHISRESNSEKVERPHRPRSNSGIGRQKEQLCQAVNAKESPDHRRPTSIGQMVEGRGDTFLVWQTQEQEILYHITSPQSDMLL